MGSLHCVAHLCNIFLDLGDDPFTEYIFIFPSVKDISLNLLPTFGHLERLPGRLPNTCILCPEALLRYHCFLIVTHHTSNINMQIKKWKVVYFL